MTEAQRSLDEYHHRLLIAADRVVQAFRTEDHAVIDREIAAAVAVPRPEGGPPPWLALVSALAVQVNPDSPLRRRIAWTYDIEALADAA